MEIENFFGTTYTGSKRYTQHHVHTANATGFGAASDDFAERGIDLNEQLIKNKPATFFMKINGTSMVNAGIFSGDVVIVDKSIRASNGKTVIAVVNGELLIRRFEQLAGKVFLIAESTKITKIEINETTDFKVWGVVTCILRML
ncbi:MAG: translesion error-prone DNA polymerase V autoproteolytic subunit [Ferruginibacter sp.]|nr:translesion error-prone DNA polymerase V autoproteolytic subunit [Ferruginibacter sp.]